MRSRRIREVTALLVALAFRVEAQATDGPPPPTRLWAAQTPTGQITFVWKLAPGATGYILYRDAGSGGGGDAHAKVATLSGNVSRYVHIVRGGGAAAQQIQQFFLASTDASRRASEKVAFNPVTLVNTTVAAVPPASVTASESSPGVITLKWTPSPGATAYFIGKIAGASGLGSACALCPTEPTYVDSGVSNGVRYQYSVAAITPSAVSARTMSNTVTPGVVTTAGGTGGSAGGTGGTGGSTTDTTRTTTADPLHGRYRVSLTGFTVQSQSYDNPLQTDGKGDEVYLATHVMKFDTASSGLVVSNEVRTSRIHGDVNGFPYRVKAGTAGLTGGLASGNEFPQQSSKSGGAGDFPIVLWEGDLVQGRSALIVVPTVWEWDNNLELFGNWVTGRHAFLARLLQPEATAAVLLNKDIRPVEVGSPGLYVHTNMFGDARDRPIGLKPGEPVKSAGFFGPLDVKGGTATYGSLGGQVVGAILPNNPFAAFAKSLFDQVFLNVGAFASSLGTTHAHLQQPNATNFAGGPIGAAGHAIANVRSAMLQNQQGVGLLQIAQVIMSARPSSISTNLYLFEQMIAITPEAVKTAFAQSKAAIGGTIDVRYTDYSSLQGQYILHIKVEQIP